MTPDQIALIRNRHAGYQRGHDNPSAFACCSAHGSADDVPSLLEERDWLRGLLDKAHADRRSLRESVRVLAARPDEREPEGGRPSVDPEAHSYAISDAQLQYSRALARASEQIREALWQLGRMADENGDAVYVAYTEGCEGEDMWVLLQEAGRNVRAATAIDEALR